MFSRDVIKREVSSSFSTVAAWLRSGRLADQNNSFSCPHLPLPPRGPWTGERVDTSRTFPPLFFHPDVLSRVSLVTEPHLREPLASEPPARALVVVHRFSDTFSRHRTFSPLVRSPSRSRCPNILVLFWLKVSRANSDDSAAGFDWLKSRDIRRAVTDHFHFLLICAGFSR